MHTPADTPSVYTHTNTQAPTFQTWFKTCVDTDSSAQARFFQEHHSGQTTTWHGLSMQEIYNQSLAIAQALHQLGINRGDIVAFIAQNSLEWDIFQYACLINGAIILGIDYHAPRDHQNHILSVASPAYVFVDTTSRLDQLIFATTPPRAIVFLKNNDPVALPNTTIIDYADLASRTELSSIPTAVTPTDPAVLIFSSGTTGLPKGILYTHEQLILALDAMAEHFCEARTLERKIMLCWMPLSNIFQRMLNLFAVQNGFKVYYCPDPLNLMTYLAVVSPSVLAGVPRVFEKVVEGAQKVLRFVPKIIRPWFIRYIIGPRVHKILGGHVKVLVSGSAKMPSHVLDFFETAKIDLYEAYGMSENLIPIASNRRGAHRKGSVGTVFPHNTVSISDTGEIMVQSPGIGAPFPASTAASQPLHTGDIGLFDEDGFLYVDGRIDNIIKTSTGVRVGAEHIENMLGKIAGVTQCMVIGNNRKLLTAIIVSTRSEQDLRNDIDVMNLDLPRRYQICDIIVTQEPFSPRNGLTTPNLKLNRRKIEAALKDKIDQMYLDIDRRLAHPPGKTRPVRNVA